MTAPIRRCSVKSLRSYSDKLAHPDHIPPIWVVMPLPVLDHYPANETAPAWGLGRRKLYVPPGAAFCATWWEAMNYATTGARYRPVAAVYPWWCGI